MSHSHHSLLFSKPPNQLYSVFKCFSSQFYVKIMVKLSEASVLHNYGPFSMCKQRYIVLPFTPQVIVSCLHAVGHSVVGASLAFQSVGNFHLILMIGACSICHLGEYLQNLISYGHRGSVL